MTNPTNLPAPESKKQYRSPQLLVYGDVQTITQAVGPMGNLDGGTITGFRKTH